MQKQVCAIGTDALKEQINSNKGRVKRAKKRRNIND